MRNLLIAALALGGSALVAPVEGQQARTADTRGLAWVGCWEAADGLAAQARVCVIPVGERDLRIVSFDAQDKVTESTLRLDGARTPVSAQDCSGWEQARLSADGERILVDAQIQCGDSPQRTVSEAFVITPSGFWLQARGSGVAMIASASIRVYRAVESYGAFPADIRAALAPFASEAEYARNTISDRPVSARDLVELESMGVAAPLIDVVVAASYPSSFVIDAGTAAPAPNTAVSKNASSLTTNPFYWSNGFPMLSYYDLAMIENCMRFNSRYSCGRVGGLYGYSARGFGFDDPVGGYYGGGYYGGSFGGYWPGAGLPVVVRPSTPPSDVPGNRGGGRAVSGSGYTSGGSSSGGTRSASPRSDNSGTTQNSGSAGVSSGSGSSGSSGAASSGGETRTAKPRNP